MRGVWVFGLVAVLTAVSQLSAQSTIEGDPLRLEARRDGASVEVSLRLIAPLPATFEEALPSGAFVRVLYPLEITIRRRFWWDKTVFEGKIMSSVVFDPVVGRYRCQLLLDDAIVVSRETPSAAVAREWLSSPPPVQLVVPYRRRPLRLRARAVFTTGTRWLVFPTARGTEWVEHWLDSAQ
jgi:hypothetical protein